MRPLLALALVGLSGAVFAVTPFSQEQAAGQLVQQFRNAGDDALAVSRALDAIAANPAAQRALMGSGDRTLIQHYIRQTGLAEARSVAAHSQAVAEAETLIQGFTKAAASGNPAAETEAVLALIENPQAVRRFNLFGDPKRVQQAAARIAQVQSSTQGLLRDRIAKHLGLPAGEIQFANITHASSVPKLGQDWDLTIRRAYEVVDPKTGKLIKVVEDIRPQQIQTVVDAAFFEAATGRAPATAAEARAFAQAKNVELTWALHKEAMGASIAEGEAIIGGKLAIRDTQQMALVSEFKAQKPIAEHAAQIAEAAEAEIAARGLTADHPEAQRILTKAEAALHKYELERARTYLKMFDKHIAPRVAGYGGKVPSRIVEANAVLKALPEDAITAREAAQRLGKLGTSIDDVVSKASGLVDAAKVLNPATAPIKIKLSEPPPNFFREQWANVRNSKVVGPLFKSLGHALSGAHVGGEFSKHLATEMDRATAVDDDIDVTYALARTWDTAIAEPASMVAELAGKGIEQGAIAIGKGMEQFADRARKVGVIRAFGEGTTLAIIKGFEGAGWALGTGAAHALGGAEYVFNNPLEAANGASLAAGEFLGVKAISDLAVRENEILIGNTIELRRQLNAHVESLANRADKLHALIARTRQAVREQDPESSGFQRDIGNAFARYEQEHKALIDDYVRWRLFLNRTYGGIENPTIADTWRELSARVARITSLPPNLAAIFDAAFINGLKSTVRLHLFDAASGEPISKGGVVQFSGAHTLSCRAQGPVMGCNGVPPGKLTMTIKVGDYATVNRDVVIQPLARRHYDQRVNLTADGPIWARISVTVRDVDTGNAIPGASIRFASNAEAARETTTTTGAVQVNQVLAGDVQITANAPGYLAGRSALRIEPAQHREYALEIQLQPDGSAKATPSAQAAPGNFDCGQLALKHNVNFSTWSCCKDHVEREMAESMCRAKRSEMNRQALPHLSRIGDAIRSQEGGRYDRQADYSDHQTPYGSLREVRSCVDIQVDDFCRRLGAGVATREEQDNDKAASRKSAVESCYARKQELINNALKSNSDGDSGFVLIYATEACKTAHKQCEDEAYAFGKACRAKATTMDEVRACNEPQIRMDEKCAYQEVQCSAAFYRQQCEEQVK